MTTKKTDETVEFTEASVAEAMTQSFAGDEAPSAELTQRSPATEGAEIAPPAELPNTNLENAASEWMADDEVASESAQEEPVAVELAPAADSPEDSASSSYVTFVQDPFNIPTIEISDAQNDQEELDLDEELSDTPSLEEETETEEEQEDAQEDTEGELETAPEIEAAAPVAPAPVTMEAAPEPDAVDAEVIAAPEGEFVAEPMNEETFAGIAGAIAEAEKQIEADREVAAAAQVEADARRLADQIAEDEALARSLAKEIEDQAKALESDAELQAALPHADAEGNLDLDELQSCVEALLFMTDKPMSVDRLHELLGPDLKLSLFQESMSALMDRYQKPYHGFELVQVAGGFQFRTKPGRAALAKKLAKVQAQRLSSGAMESLAIVAYKQPVLKDEVDKIRGVDSSHFIRGLLEKKLIRISGRSELPGRPMLYSTTADFLELFGLKELSAMPSLRELEQMIPNSQSANPEEEDPRVKELRRLVGQMNSDHSGAIDYDPREDEKILLEIRERVGAIPTSTPYLEEQKLLEKQAKLAAEQAALGIVPAVEGEPQMPLAAQMAEAPEITP